MAEAATVRAWAQETGRAQNRGKLSAALTSEWDAAHPDDPYEAAPSRGVPDAIDPDDMESWFPAAGEEPAETPPRPVPRSRARARGRGLPGIFGASKAKQGKAKKTPRVSTADMLGGLWRAGAKLAGPLPPLYRTLRVQAPVAGLVLEDAVRETVIDTVLQPFARLAGTGRAFNALLGPPVYVTVISLHMAQAEAAGTTPNLLVLGMAQEGLRSSLMAWMDVAGPKLKEAMAREREFEDKYGADVDEFMAWLFSPPPASEDEHLAEESMFRRAAGADDLAADSM